MILLTTASLGLTSALFVRALPTRLLGETDAPITLRIELAGAIWSLETEAETVGEALAEHGIEPRFSPDLQWSEEPITAGMILLLDGFRDVELLVDDVAAVLNTRLLNPRDILDEARVELSASDKIWVNGALANFEALPDWTVPAQRIRVRRAARLTIIDAAQSTTILTQADTIGEALLAAGIELHAADEVSPPLDSPVADASVARVTRAIAIELLLDGVVIQARTNAATVAEALRELDAPLFGLDYSRPDAGSPIEQAMRIEVVRVTEETVIQTEPIKHDSRFQADAALGLDQRRLLQQGADGSREIHSRVRYENGVEVSREISQTIEREPAQDHIIAYGTAITPQTIQTPQGPRQYWRRLCVYATRYNPESNGGNTNTSTGATLRKGVIAAKPQLIPYHTPVYVPGYGLGKILDTGGGLSSTIYWIDLGYSMHDYERGAGYTYVYLLGDPPADIDYVLPAWRPFDRRPGGCA